MSTMLLSEIIEKLQKLQNSHGDIEVIVLTDEGNVADIDIHVEKQDNQNILEFYY